MTPADALPLLAAAAGAAPLPLAALAFLWVAARSPVRKAARPAAPAPAADGAHGIEMAAHEEGGIHRDPLADALSGQLAWRVGSDDMPEALLDAVTLAAAALARPAAPDAGTMALLDAAWSPSGGRRPDLRSDIAVAREIDRAMAAHAWWECVAVELVDRARAASSWLRAEDLGFLAAHEPATLAALCAVPGGTVALEGAGILAHHASERAAGFPLPTPRVAPARAWIAMRAATERQP